MVPVLVGYLRHRRSRGPGSQLEHGYESVLIALLLTLLAPLFILQTLYLLGEVGAEHGWGFACSQFPWALSCAICLSLGALLWWSNAFALFGQRLRRR